MNEDIFYYLLNFISEDKLWDFIIEHYPHNNDGELIKQNNKMFYNQLKKRYPTMRVINPSNRDGYFNKEDEIVYIKYNGTKTGIPDHYFEEECDITFRLINISNLNDELEDVDNIKENEILKTEYKYHDDTHPLKKVFIEYGYSNIGKRAFAFCCNLEFIHIPSSIKFIYEDAFSYNLSLKKLRAESIVNISEGLCNHCISLENIKLHNSVSYIGKNAFRECTSLQDAHFLNKNRISNIGESAFYNCSSLETKINLCYIRNIWNYAFANCKKLSKSIHINKNTDMIYNDAFKNSSIKNIIKVKKYNKK
jgi:hypothetical protein